MPIVQFRPTSPGRRFRTGFDFSEITKARPEPSLVTPLPMTGWRPGQLVMVIGALGVPDADGLIVSAYVPSPM